jgi:hypothetical protein
MKNAISILIMGLFVITAMAQTNITNTITEAHVSVKGTKISLAPPADFVNAANFAGFQQNSSGSSIMIVEVPAPFSEIGKAFSKEGLQTQGMILLEKEQLLINTNTALLIKGEQEAYGNTYYKYTLAFGSESESILINGTYLKSNEEDLAAIIRKSLLSVVYNSEKIINPFDTVDFAITAEVTDLVFAKNVGPSLLFNREGAIPSTAPDKAIFIASKSFSELEIVDKKAYAENRIKQNPIMIDSLLSTTPITIDDLEGFEIVARGKTKKEQANTEVYQVMLFSDKLYYIFLGSSEGEYEKNLAAFKTIVKTFKRKKTK